MQWNVRTRLEPTAKSPTPALPCVDFPKQHSIIVESTTGVVACGDSWCRGQCRLPALVVEYDGKESRAFGSQVACGPVLQSFRGEWIGGKVAATLGDTTVEDAFKLMWW